AERRGKRMIRLTSYHNGSPIYVPADVIIKENYKYEFGTKSALPVTEYKPIDGAMVVYGGVEYSVKESLEEVARKVLEWQLAMERYKALAKALASASENLNAYNNELDEEEKTLLVLAGLEEPNHD